MAEPEFSSIQAPTDGARGFALGTGRGSSIELPGWSMLTKASAEDTTGQLAVLQGRISSKFPGPPPHIHKNHDETFVVLEGRIRFRIGDRFHTASAGDTVFAGRMLAHGFANPFDEAAAYVLMLNPSGYEGYFADLSDHVSREGVAPTLAVIEELLARYGTVLAPVLSDPPELRPSGQLRGLSAE